MNLLSDVVSVKERSLQSRVVELESLLSQTRGDVARQKRDKAEVCNIRCCCRRKRRGRGTGARVTNNVFEDSVPNNWPTFSVCHKSVLK